MSRADVRALLDAQPRLVVREGVRRAVARRRQALLSGGSDRSEVTGEDVRQAIEDWLRPRLARVLNATGVVLHTNLGRAPLAAEVIEHLAVVCAGYCNLELELSSGRRGSRMDTVREILLERCGAEAALVVNNNAGAVYLGLRSLAAGREVVVSRGELVEIGGSFRIPDVMAASGARLKEVGTTNKTHLADYESAIGPDTALVLKVHRSNFALVGFTAEVELEQLVSLARRRGLPVMMDMGSAALLDSPPEPLGAIPTVRQALAAGPDLLCFSGDKLLGGPQCGVLLGTQKIISQLSRDPMARALRVGKLTLAALEATLSLYRGGDESARAVPVLSMMLASAEELRARAERLAQLIGFGEVVQSRAQVGGGSLPLVELDSWAVAVDPPGTSAEQLAGALRAARPAVLSRVQHERIWLDVRTVRESELATLAAVVRRVLDPDRKREVHADADG
ncbi:MAG: L-seryl-tRNA(Sec) selenium transferase [Deltaproteobacteria bacterium]|nr:L-seryl-tRNA(Sec) selenium transferase [Deltaproteobacteria bacterium]